MKYVVYNRPFLVKIYKYIFNIFRFFINIFYITSLLRLKKRSKNYINRLECLLKHKTINLNKQKIIFFSEPNWFPFIVGLAEKYRFLEYNVEIWVNEEFDISNWPMYKESFCEPYIKKLVDSVGIKLKVIKLKGRCNYTDINKDNVYTDLLSNQLKLDIQYYEQNGWISKYYLNNYARKSIDKLRQYVYAFKNIKTLISDNADCRFITLNGKISLYGVFYKAAKSVGVDVVTFDMWEKPGEIIFDVQNPVVSWFTGNKLVGFKNANLDDAKIFYSNHHDDRINPKKSNNNDIKMQYSNFLKNDVCVDSNTCVLFTNVSWDSAILDKNTIFESMFEWIDFVFLFFKFNTDKKLIIRCHPAERYNIGTIPMHEILILKYGEIPENIKIIKGVDDQNSYCLLDIASIVLVYTGTLGLEAAARSKNVVVCGLCHYSNLGFTYSPVSKDMFYKVMVDWAHSGVFPVIDVNLAIKYYYYYFSKYAIEIPNLWTNSRGFSLQGGKVVSNNDFDWEEILSNKFISKL